MLVHSVNKKNGDLNSCLCTRSLVKFCWLKKILLLQFIYLHVSICSLTLQTFVFYVIAPDDDPRSQKYVVKGQTFPLQA
jgi:hypothetical protein